MSRPEIEQLDSRVVYRNRWMTVRQDRIRRRSGAVGLYGVVEKPDFASVVAFHDGALVLVEQYRYPAGARFWELPQGAWETATDVDPVRVAAAELREETGYEAGSLVYAGHLYQAYGYSNQRCHVFLATDLRQVGAAREPEEEGMKVGHFSLERVTAMICAGEIVDATTVAALGLLRLKGWLGG